MQDPPPEQRPDSSTAKPAEEVRGSRASQRTPNAASKSPGGSHPVPASGETITLDDILTFNGNKLWYSVAKLSRTPGKRRRAAFKEPSYEAMSEAVARLVSDSKGCARLRDLIGMGLQMGDLPENRDGVWGTLLHLTDSFLRRVSYPRAPSLSSQRDADLVEAYGATWEKVCDEASKKAKSAGGIAIKFLQTAQDVLLLDTLSAFCASKLDESGFIRTLSLLRLPEDAEDPTHGRFPWSFPALIATGVPAGIQIVQGATLHDRFDHLTKDLAVVRNRLADAEASNKLLEQELQETKEALDEEAQLLNEERKISDQLRRDVMTAGSIYKHKLDETRGRYKGLLEGDLGRHLKTIQTCVEMDPPRAKVAIERVETLLGILNRELKWLNDSE